MKAPNNRPTEKMERFIAEVEEEERLRTQQNNLPFPINSNNFVELDMQQIVDKLLQNKNIKKEIYAQASKKLEKEEDVEAVKTILSEYFECFMLLGYGVDGKRLVIKYAENDRDEDSIIELLRFALMKILQG